MNLYLISTFTCLPQVLYACYDHDILNNLLNSHPNLWYITKRPSSKRQPISDPQLRTKHLHQVKRKEIISYSRPNSCRETRSMVRIRLTLLVEINTINHLS